MGVTKAVSTPGCREERKKASVPRKVPQVQEFIVDMTQVVKENLQEEKGCKHKDYDESEMMNDREATEYRGLAARANYLAQDRPDLQFAVKEAARRMARPLIGDWTLMKRIARYLINVLRAVMHFPWQEAQDTMNIFVDSDWVGCQQTARSTSGGVAMM